MLFNNSANIWLIPPQLTPKPLFVSYDTSKALQVPVYFLLPKDLYNSKLSAIPTGPAAGIRGVPSQGSRYISDLPSFLGVRRNTLLFRRALRKPNIGLWCLQRVSFNGSRISYETSRFPSLSQQLCTAITSQPSKSPVTPFSMSEPNT